MSAQDNRVCVGCGAQTEVFETDNGIALCEDCLAVQGYAICYFCNEVLRVTTAIHSTHDNAYTCPQCFYERYRVCYGCGDQIREEHAFYSEIADETFCEDCFHERFSFCDSCGAETRSDDLFWHNDRGLCQDCYEQVTETDAIKPYQYKPQPIFIVSSKNGTHTPKQVKSVPFLGVELEIEVGNQDRYAVAEDFVTTFGDSVCYLKHDGSLCNGFEIVTEPMTLKTHKQCFNWKDKLEWLLRHDCTSWRTGTCGLHVHVNRSYFKNGDHEVQLFAIISVLCDWLRRLSGRQGKTQYCEFPPASRDLREIRQNLDKYCHSRYTALNLNNRHTVEFRFPRGTLKYESLMGTLELVDTLVDIAATHSLTFIVQKLNPDYVLLHARRLGHRHVDMLNETRGERQCAQ